MPSNDEISKIVYEKLKDELGKKPLTKEEIHNPMKKDKKDELYNAIFCYDEKGEICGYNIQVRLAEKEIYKLRFYLPIIDETWKGVKRPQDLPDKKVKIGYGGEYQSQNKLLKQNDIEQGKAMYLNFKSAGIVSLGGGFVGLTCADALYTVVRGFKYAGYRVNDATRQANESKLFV